MRAVNWAIVVLVSGGCAVSGEQIPPQGTPFVQVYTGNGDFGGFQETTIYEGDILVTSSVEEGGRKRQSAVVQAPLGRFAAVSALVAAEGSAVIAQATRPEDRCLDYGEDAVTAQPPAGTFGRVYALCPEPAIQAFTDSVRDAMTAP